MNKVLRLSFIIYLLLILGACKDNKKEKRKEDTKENIESFNFIPTRPVNGTLKGVIELGASGFNSFVINVDKETNYEVKYKEFGSSLFIEGMTNANEINDKFKEYVKKMIEYGVNPKNIHFVMSSGAKQSEIATLILPKLKGMGYQIHEVNARQEGAYALKSVLPKEFKEKAFVVDLGSGNTKISYYQGDSIVVKETYGSKYYQKSVTDTVVYKSVKNIAQGIPQNKKGLCFIIGGASYYMATTLRKQDERFTMLTTDIDAYSELVKKRGKKVESGLNIFKAIVNGTNCNRFVFDWDANFTIGFLLDGSYLKE